MCTWLKCPCQTLGLIDGQESPEPRSQGPGWKMVKIIKQKREAEKENKVGERRFQNESLLVLPDIELKRAALGAGKELKLVGQAQ